MPRSCRQCSEIIGPSDLSLDCANPRCTATCHAQCSAAATFVDDGGGRLPRWRCPDCRLASPKFVSQGGYEPVYGRPRAGDTIRRASFNQDWTVSSTALNRPSQLPLVRDKSRLHPSSHRASTGALLDIEVSKPSTASSEVRKTSNPIARPRSVILTPTEEEKQFENQPLPNQKQKMSENSSSPVKKDETTAQTVRPSDINLAEDSAQNQHYGVPISVYSPDEKYEDTVKSFYNWLEQHECRSHDKPKRGGLVADKIAQFGEKLESHLSTRQRSDIPKKSNLGTPKQYPAPKSSADRKISPEDFLDEDNGTKASEIAKKKWTTDVGNARGPTTKGQNTQSSDSIPAPPPIADINVSAGYPGTKLATVQESFGPEIGSRSSVRAPVAPKMDPNMKKFSGTNPTNELDTDVASYSGQTSRKLNPPVVHETSPKTAECKMQKAPKTINPENISDGIMEIREMRVPKSSANHQKVVHEPLFNDVLDIPCKSLADLPPPPPSLLETDLDEKLSDVEIPGRVSDNGETCTNDNKCEIEDIVRVEPMKLHDGFQVEQKGEDKLSSGQQGVHQDSRIVQHSTLPVRGQFTAKIEDSGRIVQGVLVQEVDEGQPCLACEKCQGFEPHQWRKTCNSCKCPRESHDVFHEEWVNVRERLGIGQDQDKWGSRDRVISQGLAWAPPGLPPYKVDQYFKCLPQDKVPKLGTSGEKYREKQLMIQLPKQDLALAYCRHVDPAHHTSYDDFITARNEIALDIAYAKECALKTDCPECGRFVNQGDVGVLAPKFGDKILWHPSCFICCQCKQLLVDLTYCVHDDFIYCERHYAEQLKPRCSACDELIFSGEYTKAMSKDWHSGHFCCWQCDESLTGQRYVLRDDHPYCIKCYESVFANTCDECNKTIGIDSKDLSYKDKHWHEACFFCNKCRVSLVDKQFGSKADKIYCGNCYDAQFASRCDGCGQIFRAGTKKMEYKTRQWHEQCFCCCVCKSAIGTKSFIPREQEIYCATCYEEKFATRCVKCNKIITSGGVTYKNEPWHRECFTCTNCNTSLAGQRFTSRDEKPYCADCFGELFAKRCTSCCKPITGIGGTRFISFEDRHWHNDCFICASCKTSLVGRGFITDAEDILCTECAKQKLM